MYSIKEIYKIGYGPSSSHTMGPHRAAELFKSRTAAAASYRVTLYGSLAATGKGHLTDYAVEEGLKPTPTEIIWRPDIVQRFHANGMHFEAFDASGQVQAEWTVYSVGGGSLAEETPGLLASYEGKSIGGESSIGSSLSGVGESSLYPHRYLSDIQRYTEQNGLSFWEYVEKFEGKEIWDYLAMAWEQMQATVREGLENDAVLPGQLHLRSKAKQYYVRASSFKPSLQSRALVTAYALAVAEQNARGGQVVTAPTCGSCGVVPAVLYHMKQAHAFSDRDILKALATAGLFGNVIKTNASISGAEVGCQGEVGSACVMAAVATNQLFGGSPQQIECAAEMAMEHNLGLTCDPVCGLVQIPCIERNAIAALRAQDVSLYALMSDGKHMVSFDSIVETMKNTGHDLPSPYKETAQGGIAATYK